MVGTCRKNNANSETDNVWRRKRNYLSPGQPLFLVRKTRKIKEKLHRNETNGRWNAVSPVHTYITKIYVSNGFWCHKLELSESKRLSTFTCLSRPKRRTCSFISQHYLKAIHPTNTIMYSSFRHIDGHSDKASGTSDEGYYDNHTNMGASSTAAEEGYPPTAVSPFLTNTLNYTSAALSAVKNVLAFKMDHKRCITEDSTRPSKRLRRVSSDFPLFHQTPFRPSIPNGLRLPPLMGRKKNESAGSNDHDMEKENVCKRISFESLK